MILQFSSKVPSFFNLLHKSIKKRQPLVGSYLRNSNHGISARTFLTRFFNAGFYFGASNGLKIEPKRPTSLPGNKDSCTNVYSSAMLISILI